ncbi:MAG TPA: glutamyl-tRNA reductase [Candidatus Dormibacteraeota bacterium]|nr:glutamyl-tRNA reductase [Candidatus Dormibacteraeota bacterium]
MELVAAGLTFRTAPLAVRERAVVPETEARHVLRYLVGHSGLRAAAVLSTCNRTEFYMVSPDGTLADEAVPRLARYLDPASSGEVASHLWSLRGADAVRHMFRVAAGLDSMMLGEAQILGQFKSAHRTARVAGTVDAQLDFVMRRAVSVGKRVRTETGIGRRAGSLSEAAVEYARTMFGGSLAGRGVLLLGAGKMSAQAAARLAQYGAHLSITSRGGESAVDLAGRLGGVPVALGDIDEAAAKCDVVLCSTSSPVPVLTAADVERMQALRGHRPLCIVDIAVPRDVDPAAGNVTGVTLVDLDGLGERVDSNLEGRRREMPAAERIVEEELENTVTVIGQRDAAGPTIAALTRRAETLRSREVDRALQGLDVDDALRSQVDVLTRSLVRKLLHGPIAHLKDSADDPSIALVLREAFELDDPRAGSPAIAGAAPRQDSPLEQGPVPALPPDDDSVDGRGRGTPRP